MKITETKLNSFFTELKKNKIQTMQEMSKRLGVSSRQVSTYLKRKNVKTSFNKNGKYYALADIMEYDKYGIWEYKGICFSNIGNLTQTFTSIVTNSNAGLGHDEIKKILRLPRISFLSAFSNLKGIRREKISGKYIYFSDSNLFLKQKMNRLKLEESSIVDTTAISILKKHLQYPDLSSQELFVLLKTNGVNVTLSNINDLFSKYGIIEKSRFTVVKILKELMVKVGSFIDPNDLFDEMPEIVFDARKEDWCTKQFKVKKTDRKLVQTLHIGKFWAKYQVMENGSIQQISKELLSIVAPGCNYGYDVIVRVGELIHLQHKQAKEVCCELQKNNIKISKSEVEELAKKFFIYLSIIHEQKTNKIVEIMDSNGGYILHLDALGDAGNNRVISGIDSLTDFVLGNSKITTENSDEIVPFLEKIKNNFGIPLRIVQDMGVGLMKAVKKIFPEKIILICHFHFLRDIGKDFLEDNYDLIRKRLRHFAFLTKLRDIVKSLKTINSNNLNAVDSFYSLLTNNKQNKVVDNSMRTMFLYTLVLWILDWENSSNGYGFPFDRPKVDLANRITKAHKLISNVQTNNDGMAPDIIKYYYKTFKILDKIVADKELGNAMKNIKGEINIFESLRKAMRIAPKGGGKGLNDDCDDTNINTIKKSVTKFKKKLETNSVFLNSKNGSSFIKQLNKYWSKLFSDPFTVNTKNGSRVIQPQRTNNISERAFREITRAYKRKSGSDNIGKTIKAMVDDMPLVRNLKNVEYVKLILGEKKELHEVFAEVDPKLVKKRMEELKSCYEDIPSKILELLDDNSFIEKMSKING